MHRYKGAITVFLSLISILFLSLFCTMLESARIQGARFQAAAAFDMGLFSVFGEYDRVLLEEYDLWFLDAGEIGTVPERLGVKLQNDIMPNLNPARELRVAGSWNLFPTELETCTVERYALATDNGGEVFYQQAVENEKELFAGHLADGIRRTAEEMKKQEKQAENYQNEEKTAEINLEQARQAQAEAEAAQKEQPGEAQQPEPDAGEGQETGEPSAEKKKNPLDVIKKLKKTGVLSLVMKDTSRIEKGKLKVKDLPSKRTLQKGNLKIKENKSPADEAVFLSYLKKHFQCAVEKDGGRGLVCELEYLIGGKETDVENLKRVVHKLLLIREGVNYACISGSQAMKGEALALAAAIAGSTAVPALTTALQKALMLAWAYGESLLDLRVLLAGGRTPLIKTEKDWKLSLERLIDLEQVLEECDAGGGKGQTYQEYLTGLLALTAKKQRNLRALDLIEAYRRGEKGGETFRADALTARIEAKGTFVFAPVFLAVPAAFFKLPNQALGYQITGGYGYMEGGG